MIYFTLEEIETLRRLVTRKLSILENDSVPPNARQREKIDELNYLARKLARAFDDEK